MSDFIDIAALEEIPEGTIRAFDVRGHTIAVCRTSRGVFAVDDSCPHRGGPLSEGDVQGCEIICPWHFWTFDAATGCHTGGSKFSVATHDVRIEEGRILVRLTPPADSLWKVQ